MWSFVKKLFYLCGFTVQKLHIILGLLQTLQHLNQLIVSSPYRLLWLIVDQIG